MLTCKFQNEECPKTYKQKWHKKNGRKKDGRPSHV